MIANGKVNYREKNQNLRFFLISYRRDVAKRWRQNLAPGMRGYRRKIYLW